MSDIQCFFKYQILFLCLPIIAYAQSEHEQLVEANNLYKAEKYDEAAAGYETILQEKKSSLKGHYNLGNVRYLKKDYENAIKHYEKATQLAETDNQRANAYHNLGNAYVNKEEFEKAVGAYKNSLRLNPKDLDTKHNLAQAMRYIKRNQPPKPEDEDKNNKPPPPPKEEEGKKDELDNMMDIIDNEDKKTQEKKKKNKSQTKRPPAKDW